MVAPDILLARSTKNIKYMNKSRFQVNWVRKGDLLKILRPSRFFGVTRICSRSHTIRKPAISRSMAVRLSVISVKYGRYGPRHSRQNPRHYGYRHGSTQCYQGQTQTRPKIQGLHLEDRQYLRANAEPNNLVALDFPLTGLS